jgi:hypothetical protein
MAEPTDEKLGTRDLEKGMRPSPASTFRTIALNAVILLLLFNSAGLVRWAQQLPSNSVNAWLAERAADWDRMMHVPPADVLEGIKKLLKMDGS